MAVMPGPRWQRLRAIRPRGPRGNGGRPSLPRPSRGLTVTALVLLLALGGGWLWLRDSALVAVRHVSIVGNTGPDQGQIRAALIRVADNMTTLDVQPDKLKTALAPYPVVKDVQVSTKFPHGLRIHVVEQIPVGAVDSGGRRVAVSGDGTFLRDLPATSLATIPLRVPPGGTRLSDHDAQGALAALAAAPYAMLDRIGSVTADAAHGIVAQLRSGPSIQFGDPSRLAAKWSAVIAVLADPGSAGAAYLNVSDPGRPAAGVSKAQAGLVATAGSGAAGAAAAVSSAASGAGAAGATAPGG